MVKRKSKKKKEKTETETEEEEEECDIIEMCQLPQMTARRRAEQLINRRSVCDVVSLSHSMQTFSAVILHFCS